MSDHPMLETVPPQILIKIYTFECVYVTRLDDPYNLRSIGKVFSEILTLKGNAAYLKKNLLWMKTMHYPNTIRSHMVTIVPMEPFALKSTSKLRSALHIRYSKVISRFISRANTA